MDVVTDHLKGEAQMDIYMEFLEGVDSTNGTATFWQLVNGSMKQYRDLKRYIWKNDSFRKNICFSCNTGATCSYVTQKLVPDLIPTVVFLN